MGVWQAGAREYAPLAAAAAAELGPSAVGAPPRRSVVAQRQGSVARRFSQATSPLFAPGSESPAPDGGEPSEQQQAAPDQAPPPQPDQAAPDAPADAPAPASRRGSREEADGAAPGSAASQGGDADGGSASRGSSPRGSGSAEQQPESEPEPDEDAQPAEQDLPAGAVQALHLGVQQALAELEGRLEGLQDDVDSMSLIRDADRQVIATLEAQLLGAQKLGLLPPDTALKAAGLLTDDMDLEGAKADLIPAYAGDRWRASGAPAEQSMRSVRRALSVITNASYIMSVGESMPMLDQVRGPAVAHITL